MVYHATRTGFAFSITYLADDFGINRHLLGTVDMCFLFSYGLSQLFLGYLSDKWNYKKFLAVGIFTSTGAIYILCILTWTYVVDIYMLCVL